MNDIFEIYMCTQTCSHLFEQNKMQGSSCYIDVHEQLLRAHLGTCNVNSMCNTHGNTVQHTATHCIMCVRRLILRCNTLQLTATHCNSLQRTAMHCIIAYKCTPRYLSAISPLRWISFHIFRSLVDV